MSTLNDASEIDTHVDHVEMYIKDFYEATDQRKNTLLRAT